MKKRSTPSASGSPVREDTPSLGNGPEGISDPLTGPALDLEPINFERFESLGDNCELGFVQRAKGFDKGGLLRWALSQPEPLLRALADDFQELYQYENLVASADDMVRDTRYGLFFHTAMKSSGKQFIHAEEERRKIYDQEKVKIEYLLGRFRTRLEDPETIVVYKTNTGVSDELAESLRGAVRVYGSAALLIVRLSGEREQWGTVEHRKDGLFVGFLDKFAPYAKADDASIDLWCKLLSNVQRCVGARND